MPDHSNQVHALLERWANERPDYEAMKFGDRAWSWAQLAQRVARGAAAQRAAGLRPGDRVAVLDLNHPSTVEITLACAQVGTVSVVVNFRLAPTEITYVLNDSGAKVVFVGPEFAELVDGLRAELPSVRRVVPIGGPVDAYEEWLAVPPDSAVYPAEADDCLLQLYTSGTTGFPKGAMLTHRGLITHSENLATVIKPKPDSTFMVAMPLFHVSGSAMVFFSLYHGVRSLIVRRPEPAEILELLQSERVTHTFLVPALLALIAKLPNPRAYDLSALRVLLYGASPMPLPVLRESMKIFPNVFMQVYGMTEASGAVTLLGSDEHADPANAHRLVSAGKPISGVRIEVRDSATDQPVRPGEAGEVWVRTRQLMSGYWNKPEATASAISDDGWYRSGDAGYLDADGYLYITDRIKDLIISGGENIYPAEIERVLAEHPSIEEVTVVGVPDEKWGEVPKAVVVAADGHTVDEAQLLAYCREHLASYKCPKSVDVVEELPRNPTGKVLKKDVRARYWEGRESTLV